jgi:hypothetical protein
MTFIRSFSTGLLCLSISNFVLAAESISGNDQYHQDFSTLTKTLQQTSNTEKEFIVEKMPGIFLLTGSSTSFSNIAPEIPDPDYPPINSDNVFPTKKPEGVTADEWQALLASNLDFFAENGNVSYELRDLNQDGKRDLIVDTYVGGTGLYNEILLLKRDENIFVRNPYEQEEGYFYSLNGRGSNQSAHWIEINQHIYLLYQDSLFGQDSLQLKKPFADNQKNSVIQITYTYDFSIEKNQKPVEGKEYTLDDKTYAALVKAIKPLNKLSASREAEDLNQVLCPNLQEDQPGNLGAGHYSIEIVANFPIWINRDCYFGRVVNWFGGYDAQGLFAQLWYAHPDTPDKINELQVFAKRKIKSIRY